MYEAIGMQSEYSHSEVCGDEYLPTFTVNMSFDCTQREIVVDIANRIYQAIGYKAPDRLMYFFESQHPTEKAILQAAEDIFEMFNGDSPDYSDDEDEDE